MPNAAGLYYFLHSSGSIHRPPLLLLHGAGGHHLFWPPDVRRLAGTRVLSPDLPGHGRSEGTGLQSIAAYMEVLVDFLDEAGLNRVVAAGHSMGGAIALLLALSHPERVAGLVLAATAARLRVSPEILEDAANAEKFPAVIRTIVDWSFGPGCNPRLKSLAGQRMGEIRPTVLLGDFTACNEFDVRRRLGEIRVPALVLAAREDRMVPRSFSESLAQGIAGAQLCLIENAGHMLPLEQPQQLAQALLDFLPTVPYQPGM
ncbi:MAG: alpha/beta fold hydrolase [Chloroflexi bacterium]|nr:alpha/beta fold hydrolase [Chloroflexota bacterium]